MTKKVLKLKRKWKHYGMRTSDPDGRSHGGFQWPATGMVECPDWDAKPRCGNGLHALLNGEGDASLLNWSDNAVWQMVGFDEYVCLGGKVKFPRCEVVTGTREQVTSALIALTNAAVHAGTATAGDAGTAAAGYAGRATAGYAGTATAGDAGTATAGNRGRATAGYAGRATAGYAGTATAGDDGTATAGNRGRATAGYAGTATAGDDGVILIKWWDGQRYRFAEGYVGENGIEPNKPYRVVGGKLVAVA